MRRAYIYPIQGDLPTHQEMQGHILRLHEEEQGAAEVDRRRRLRLAMQAASVLYGSALRAVESGGGRA